MRLLRLVLSFLLLVAVALCGVYFGYVVPYEKQYTSGSILEEKGVTLEWRASKPTWLMATLGALFDVQIFNDCVFAKAEHCGLTDADLIHLRRLPRLERLYLASNPITDDGLKHLRGLRHLERLSLWRTNISDEGMRHLAGLESLRVLDIHHPGDRVRVGSSRVAMDLGNRPSVVHSRLTARCLRHLAECPNLNELYFSFLLDDEALSQLANFPNLRLRTLFLRNLSDAGLSQLPRWRTLEMLSVRGKFTTDGLRHLGRLPRLRGLWLTNLNKTPDTGEWLSDLRQLKWLSMEYCSINDEAMPFLGKLNQLDRLSLTGARITDDGVASIASLTSLTELNLLLTPLTADCLRHLVPMQQLQTLHFRSALDDDAVEYLAQLPNLREVISNSSIYADFGSEDAPCELYLTDRGLDKLSKLNCFHHIKLRDAIDGKSLDGVDIPSDVSTMTDVGLAKLWQNDSIEVADISGRDVTAAGLRWTKSAQRCRFVKFMSPRPADEVLTTALPDEVFAMTLRGNHVTLNAKEEFGPDRIEIYFSLLSESFALLRCATRTTRLEILNSSFRRLRGGWDDLQSNPNLLEFRSILPIDAVGITQLGKMKQLREVEIQLPNGFPSKDLSPLGNLNRLETLNLYYANLDDETLQILSQITNLRTLRMFALPTLVVDQHALRHLIELKRLQDLMLYGIQDEGMAYLGQINSLARLSVSGKEITDEGLRQLDELPSLEYLDARSSGITDEGLNEFQKRHRIHVRTDR